MKIALCIGHSRSGDNGAVSVAGVSEWDFNTSLWPEVVNRLEEVDYQIYDDYEGSSYGSAMSWVAHEIKIDDCDVAVEFHFNAASASAKGFEYLYWHSSSNGQRLAQCFLDSHATLFPNSKDRGIKPKSSGDRGSGFLSKTHCPAIILEPFFGSNHDEWETYSENMERLAQVYSDAIQSYVNDN